MPRRGFIGVDIGGSVMAAGGAGGGAPVIDA